MDIASLRSAEKSTGVFNQALTEIGAGVQLCHHAEASQVDDAVAEQAGVLSHSRSVSEAYGQSRLCSKPDPLADKEAKPANKAKTDRMI